MIKLKDLLNEIQIAHSYKLPIDKSWAYYLPNAEAKHKFIKSFSKYLHGENLDFITQYPVVVYYEGNLGNFQYDSYKHYVEANKRGAREEYPLINPPKQQNEIQVTQTKIPYKIWIELWSKLFDKYDMKTGYDEFNSLVDDYLIAHGFGFNGLDMWYETGMANDINGFYRLLQRIDKEGLNINEIQVTNPIESFYNSFKNGDKVQYMDVDYNKIVNGVISSKAKNKNMYEIWISTLKIDTVLIYPSLDFEQEMLQTNSKERIMDLKKKFKSLRKTL